jgi:hypothetical protein
MPYPGRAEACRAAVAERRFGNLVPGYPMIIRAPYPLLNGTDLIKQRSQLQIPDH